MMDQEQLWNSLCRMNQIRYYQLRMMEQAKESLQREVYKDLIRGLIAENGSENANIPASIWENRQG